MRLLTLVIFFTLYIEISLGAGTTKTSSLIVFTLENTRQKRQTESTTSIIPKIYQMHVKSLIKNRYAHTTVVSKVMNNGNDAQEAIFSISIPESAFISGFLMEINGRNYTAVVRERDEAKKIYDEAVSKGLGAGHVSTTTRYSNHFSIAVNVLPQTAAAFYLNYEELLRRINGHYELVINLHPGQLVHDLSAEVVISESLKLTGLKAPPIRSGNELKQDKMELYPRVKWAIANDTTAVIIFNPELGRQKQLARLLGTEEDAGLEGQFVVQYDVERDSQGGEVLIQDGYFVHYFAPSELHPFPKHIIFILDTSESMQGEKIVQLKEAMGKILEELHSDDLFHVVEFNSNVRVWNLDEPDSTVWFESTRDIGGRFVDFHYFNFPNGYEANVNNIRKAKGIISHLMPQDSTNIYTALHVGLYLAEKSLTAKREPLIMFLTDGQPTVGIKNTHSIVNDVTDLLNSGKRKTPIFSLSFGDEADRNFLQRLSLRNSGFTRHIYEAADASLQLQHFYNQISSPLLANVSFTYTSNVHDLTQTNFPLYFGGSELVVAGLYGKSDHNLDPPRVDAWNGQQFVMLEPTIQPAVAGLERLWAYMTVKQLLEKWDTCNDKERKEYLREKALELALQYSFVTPVSSLVVRKPNVANSIDTEFPIRGSHAVYDVKYFSRGNVSANIIYLHLVVLFLLLI